ncbi:RCC1 domain-containing protein [Paenibacillus cremeus]|uniref:RCC1 repeat-containing protein n=1 Tax=Paenibacillus cremeus TaxID=2163881 RepID=A0A559KA90_9BACL|nr:S-layer homology domain-containing protein [Paenibacillus cremeus]TVY09045.1 RCC1 repeat-containing protein [Paenibacillus cremeus]
MNATSRMKFKKASLLQVGLAVLLILSMILPMNSARAESSAQSGFSDLVQITGGSSHTVALKSDGTVWAWGDNQLGKLGAQAVVNRYIPIRVKELSDVKSLAAGLNHTLALKKDGTVWAWGSNNGGQLGDGSKISHATPTKVEGLNDIIAVAAGNNHSVALRDDGVVFTWGDNTFGQLGDASYDPELKPKRITDNMPPVVSIASGANHVIAITKDRDMIAWGDNSSGQLGLGGNSIGGSINSRMYVSGLRNMKSVAAGSNFSLALKDDGVVYAWGSNASGQLGTPFIRNISGEPGYLVGLGEVKAIAAGNSHAIILTKDGDVYTWGANAFGQLGLGNYDKTNTLTNKIADLSHVVSIAAGSFYSMAVKDDGSVWTWGNNAMGQLGDGTTTTKTVPTQVPRFSLNASQPLAGSTINYTNELGTSPLSAGDSFTQVIKNGKVWSWGENTYGQLGNGSSITKNSPQPLDSLSDAAQIAAGTSHSVVLQRNGTVVSWGLNYSGQLGDGGTASKSTPAAVPGLTDVTQIASGANFSFYLKKDATLWASGDNTLGQLADGTIDPKSSPGPIEGLPLAQAVAAGYSHALALSLDGSVWAWGDNTAGQLGDGTQTPRRAAVQSKIKNVVSIAAGRNFSLALKTDGTVWAWGYNAFGQLGDGTTTNRSEPVQVSGLTGVTAIAAGGYHALAITKDGTVWAWGANTFGQLGDGGTSNRNKPSQLPLLTGARYVAAGTYHSAVMDDKGTVWTWGSNGSGQLGDGGYKSRSLPAVVTGFRPTFSDTAGHWAQSSIDAAVEKGMVDGYPNGTFGPDLLVTRSELAKLAATALRLKVADPAPGQQWYEPYVKVLQDAGIVGTGDMLGAWDAPATRAELARLAVRATTKEMQTANTVVDNAFAMKAAVKAGIMQGLSGGRLAPEETTTRAQAIAVIERMLSVNAGLKLAVDNEALKNAQ